MVLFIVPSASIMRSSGALASDWTLSAETGPHDGHDTRSLIMGSFNSVSVRNRTTEVVSPRGWFVVGSPIGARSLALVYPGFCSGDQIDAIPHQPTAVAIQCASV